MSPNDTKKETLKNLRRARKEMMSAAWTVAIRKEPDEVRRKAALKLLDINDAIHELQNANLAEIRDKLIANEGELLEGTAKLGQALDNLNQVRKVLNTAAQLLDVLAKVVKFVVTSV